MRSINQYYLKQCVWSQTITNQISKNTHQKGITKKMVKQFDKYKKYGPLYMFKTVNNLDQPKQRVLQRLINLFKIQNEDQIVSINQYGIKQKNSKLQIFVVTNYFSNSMNLTQLKNSQKYKQYSQYPSKVSCIFHKIAYALHKAATNYKLAHLRLHPNCVLIKVPEKEQKNSTWMVRLCDFGLGIQKNRSYQYSHPDLYQKVNPYQLGQKQCFKYDLWSFGVMMFYCLFGQLPFSKQQLLTLKKKEQFDKILQIHITRSDSYFRGIIYKCFGIQQPFQNWGQIIQQIQSQNNISAIQKVPIQQIYTAHISLCYLISNIYIIIRKKIKYYQNQTQSSPWIKDNRMKHLSQIMMMNWLYSFHLVEFKKYFESRCYIFGPQALCALDTISENIQQEFSYLKSRQSLVCRHFVELQLQKIFSNDNNKYKKLLVSVKMVDDSQKNKDNKLNLVCKFFNQFNKCEQKAQKIFKDPNMDRQAYLNAFYESQIFRKMANQDFHFSMEAFTGFINIK